MAVIAFVAGTAFTFTFRGLDKRDTELNKISAGHVHQESFSPAKK